MGLRGDSGFASRRLWIPLAAAQLWQNSLPIAVLIAQFEFQTMWRLAGVWLCTAVCLVIAISVYMNSETGQDEQHTDAELSFSWLPCPRVDIHAAQPLPNGIVAGECPNNPPWTD